MPDRPLDPRAEEVLASALRDEGPAPDGRSIPIEAIVDAAAGHGVAPLLHDHLARSASWPAFPEGLAERLERHSILSALQAERRREEISRVLETIRQERLDVLLMKGVPLSYTHYRRPGLRPALDTDVLFPPGGRAALERALTKLGYERTVEGTGQATFRRADVTGGWHVLDCHESIAGTTVDPRDFPFEELAARSAPVPALGPDARTLDATDALLLCGIHFAHHFGRERLLWLYDVRLIVSGLGPDGFRRFVLRARSKRVSAVCAAILRRAEHRLGPLLPENALDELCTGSPRARWIREPSAGFLPGRSALLFESMATLRNLPRWNERARFLRDLLVGHGLPDGTGERADLRRVGRRVTRGVVQYVILGRPPQR